MNKIYEIIEDMRQHFGWDKSDTIEFVKSCILEEAQELQDASTKLEQESELADVLMYAFTLAKMLDVDIEEIIKEKAEIVKGRNYD